MCTLYRQCIEVHVCMLCYMYASVLMCMCVLSLTGPQMMVCVVCCQMFHSFCVGVACMTSSPTAESYTCPFCVTCGVCGDGENVSV